MPVFRLCLAIVALAVLGACSTGGVVGGTAGAAAGYAVDEERGAVIGGVGGAVLGDALLDD